MIKRPQVGETEEDLLKQEAEFLKQSGKAPARKRIHDVQPNQSKSDGIPGVIGDIVEKNQRSISAPNGENVSTGFPALFEIDPNIAPKKKGKKSLFALHMEKNKKNSSMEVETQDVAAVSVQPMEYEESPRSNTQCVNDMSESIHKESLEKMAKMSEAEILEAQKKLYEMLDPKLINLLKERGKAKEKTEPAPVEVMKDVEMQEISDDIKEKLTGYVGEKWVNLDFVEKEKLEWVGDIPDAKALEPDQPYSARFDFKGELQPFAAEIDVTRSLHHHGEEPERPGYTIQELYQLSRSTVLQQRVLALNTIANIIRKTKLGYYDFCFDGFLLHKLLESDLFLLLRFSIDDNALIPSAINCLRRLLYNDTDEYCLDKLLGVTDDDVQPFLFDEMETNEDEEKELKDNTIINCDVIKGVLRTDLVVRISYILNKLPCDRETVTNALLCFIRIARHSIDSSKQLVSNPDLMDFVYSCINSPRPIYQGVKLFRLLASQSDELASRIAKYPMSVVVSYLNAESMPEITRTEFYLLKLECVYLWRNLLGRGHMVDDFASWTPCCIRLLRFYVEKVDLCGEGDFDFELFSAIMSLLRLSARKRLPVEAGCVAAIYVCVEKWLKQLMHFQKFNFAGLKALGGCFAFLTDHFADLQVELTGLRFIENLNPVILTLIASPVFDAMTANLVTYSHVLALAAVKRDPKNLPSLCSVYEGGRDFVRIVNNQSSLAFFLPFVKYLACSYRVTHGCRSSIEALARSCNFRKFLGKILKIKQYSDNWFNRFEGSLLTSVCHLLCIEKDSFMLELGFRLLPMLRVDDDNSKFVLGLLTDKSSWKSDADFFSCLTEVYLKIIYRPAPDVRYNNELIGEDWMYKIMTHLRGREAVAENVKALKFISHVRESNPNLLSRVPYSARYHNLCAVFLTDSNVFDDEIERELKKNFESVLANRDKIRLHEMVNKTKSFYDLYTELITQYAGVSYGLHVFAEFVLFPLQNRYDLSFRKLLWFEYLHVLRVITLPYPAENFIGLEDFVEPPETDESLLVAYLNSVSTGVITRNRNPFVYNIAVGNVKNYLRFNNGDERLGSFLRSRISSIKNERVRQDLLS